MFIMDDVTGDMTIRQGDSYSFSVSGISDDWTVYYSIYRGTNREILFETSTTPVNEVATFNITPAESNILTVPSNKKTETYFYGIKRCRNGVEDTVIVGTKKDGTPKLIGELNKILVYPLITEGDDNGTS